MSTLRSAGRPFEDLHNRAVPGLARGNGVISRETLGAQQRDMLTGKLQQFRLLARFRFIRDDDNGFT